MDKIDLEDQLDEFEDNFPANGNGNGNKNGDERIFGDLFSKGGGHGVGYYVMKGGTLVLDVIVAFLCGGMSRPSMPMKEAWLMEFPLIVGMIKDTPLENYAWADVLCLLFGVAAVAVPVAWWTWFFIKDIADDFRVKIASPEERLKFRILTIAYLGTVAMEFYFMRERVLEEQLANGGPIPGDGSGESIGVMLGLSLGMIGLTSLLGMLNGWLFAKGTKKN